MMGNRTEDMLNVTMRRLEFVMQDTKAALDNKAEKLIKAAILMLKNCTHLEKEKKLKAWEKLLEYAKELYIQIIVQIPESGKKDQYSQSYDVMEEILVCKRNMQLLMET